MRTSSEITWLPSVYSSKWRLLFIWTERPQDVSDIWASEATVKAVEVANGQVMCTYLMVSHNSSLLLFKLYPVSSDIFYFN